MHILRRNLSFSKGFGVYNMKKMMLGITLILFSVILYIFYKQDISWFHNDIVLGIYVILPFIGMLFSILGFIEKDK